MQENKKINFCSVPYNHDDCCDPINNYWRMEENIYSSNKEYLNWGSDNLAPQKLIELYSTSSLHQSLSKSIAQLIGGAGVIDEKAEYNPFLTTPNFDEDLHSIVNKLSFDSKLFAGFALNIIKSKYNKEKFAQIYHLPLQNLRPKVENGKVVGYWYSVDWSKRRTNKIFLPLYTPGTNIDSTVYVVKAYTPSLNPFFPTPDYIGAIKQIQTEAQISRYQLNLVSNNMSGRMHLSLKDGKPGSEEVEVIKRKATENFTGTENAGGLFITFSDNPETAPVLTPINSTDADKQYIEIYSQVQNSLIIAHRIPDPKLIGLLVPGKLGGTEDLLISYEMLTTMVINPYQKLIETALTKLFKANGIDSQIKIEELKPFTTIKQ